MSNERPLESRSIYDSERKPEEDLWFMPAPHAEAETSSMPWEFADRESRDAADWKYAEQTNAVSLARAAMTWGALRDRVKQLGQGALHRVALMQVAELSWHHGDRLSEDRIALYLAARITRAGDDMQGFERASWSYRRLLDSTVPERGKMTEWLGRRFAGDNPADYINRPTGSEFAALEEVFWSHLSDLPESHSITLAAYAWSLWRRLGLSDEANQIEGVVAAAKLGGAPFLPIDPRVNSGELAAQVQAFYAGLETFCLSALMQLDRINAWHSRATSATAHLSGRTPSRLIVELTRWPMLSAEALENQTGASRAAVQRNIDKLASLGLITEVTGHQRFRMWKARV